MRHDGGNYVSILWLNLIHISRRGSLNVILAYNIWSIHAAVYAQIRGPAKSGRVLKFAIYTFFTEDSRETIITRARVVVHMVAACSVCTWVADAFVNVWSNIIAK